MTYRFKFFAEGFYKKKIASKVVTFCNTYLREELEIQGLNELKSRCQINNSFAICSETQNKHLFSPMKIGKIIKKNLMTKTKQFEEKNPLA